jgi:hypothetical protein
MYTQRAIPGSEPGQDSSSFRSHAVDRRISSLHYQLGNLYRPGSHTA